MAVLKRVVTLLQVATPSRGINGQDERCISYGAVDSTARSCFMGNQGGQAPSMLALPFKSRDNGNRIFGTFCPTSRGRRFVYLLVLSENKRDFCSRPLTKILPVFLPV